MFLWGYCAYKPVLTCSERMLTCSELQQPILTCSERMLHSLVVCVFLCRRLWSLDSPGTNAHVIRDFGEDRKWRLVTLGVLFVGIRGITWVCRVGVPLGRVVPHPCPPERASPWVCRRRRHRHRVLGLSWFQTKLHIWIFPEHVCTTYTSPSILYHKSIL